MKPIVLLDGGLGTELRFRGIEVPSHVSSIWSAQALIDNPKLVEQIHADYIQAGADCITINNYSLTQPILSRAHLQKDLDKLINKAINLAQNAVKKSNKEIKIIGSIPPLETSYRADLILSENEMSIKYKEITNILKGKVDILLCETMSSGIEAKCAVEAGMHTNIPVWLSWTLHGNRPNHLPSGESLDEAFNKLEQITPEALLVNCAGANLIGRAIKKIAKFTKNPIGGYANSENIIKISEVEQKAQNIEELHNKSSVSLSEKEYGVEVDKWLKAGASIVGGCCRTRPSHIRELRRIIDKY